MPRANTHRERRLAQVLCLWLPCLLAAPRAAAETSIDFWAVGVSIDDVEMYRRVAEEFRQRTGTRVRVTPLGWGDYDTKYFAAMAAGLPPDVGVTSLGGPMHYGAVGGLVDLAAEFPEEIEELKGRFYPDILPKFTFQGRLFGLPTEVATVILYYRKDIFQRLGIKPPLTWSELDAAIRAVERHGMRFYHGWTRNEQWSAYFHTLPFGLPGVRRKLRDGTLRPGVDWTEPRYQQGILHAMDLWHMHESLGETSGKGLGERGIGRFLSDDPDEVIPLFVDENKVYQAIMGLFPEQAHKWDVVPWPRADDGAAVNVVGGTAYVIFSRSKHKRAAFEFLRHLNSLPVQQALLLDRMSRGKRSAFTISPVRALWAEENAAFFRDPRFAGSERLVEVLRQTVRTFRTTEEILGKKEADLIELGIFDRMGGYILDEMTALAGRHGLTRWQLVKELARGLYADEKRALDQRIAARLGKEYAAAVGRAEEILLREERHYEARYGDVLRNLRSYQHRADVLTCLEWAVLILLFGLGGLVGGVARLRRHMGSYLYIATPVTLSLVFVFIPALTALYLSFTEYHPVLPLSSARPVGLGNYVEVIASGDLIAVIGRTAVYVLVTVPLGVAISLVLAALLNQPIRGTRIWRFVYFSPFVTSAVSVALIFAQLYEGSELGWLNAALLRLGLIRDALPFLQSESSFLSCVIVLAVWHGLAFNVLIFLAALQQVPTQLYKAAEVDGAGWLRKFWHVSLPGIRPQILFITIMGVIGGFQVFEPIYMLGGGSGYSGAKFGPNDAGLTMVPYIYNAGFERFRMGLASAIGYLLFALIFVFTLVQFRLTRTRSARRGGGSSWR